MKDKQGKGRYLAQFHRPKRCEVGRLKLYRTVTRDLAGRAEWGSLTLSGLDLGAAIDGQYQGLLGIGRQTISTVTMKILHQEQMKLDDHRRADHHPTVQSTSGEANPQAPKAEA